MKTQWDESLINKGWKDGWRLRKAEGGYGTFRSEQEIFEILSWAKYKQFLKMVWQLKYYHWHDTDMTVTC